MNTITSIIRDHIESHPDRIILRFKRDAKISSATWRELGGKVDLLGCALLDLGVKIGDRVAILSENRPEWAYADLAILSCGAVTIPIYASCAPKDVEYILKDSGAEVIFVSGKDQLEKIFSVNKVSSIKRIITFETSPNIDPLVTEFNVFLKDSRKRLSKYADLLKGRGKAVGGEDPVTIIYTSGSTGPPKGVVLTNNNFISNCRASAGAINIDSRDRYLSFLPLSHVFERMAGYYLMMIQGGEIAYAERRDTILEDARLFSPTFMCGVPRFFEKLYAEILNKAIRSSFIKKNLFFWGYRIGRACLFRKLRKRPVPLYLAIQKFLVTKPISKKLKKLFGGKLRFFVSGGAPLSKEVAYFFLSFDIPILEGYGLTESSPVIAVNRLNEYKVGTVGKPIQDISVKMASDGEILTKGPNLMKGYYHLYKDTESIVREGWLHTGDIGHIDKDGFLVITDRKKDIIVTSGGKNIAPQEIETLIKADRFIQDVLVYGDKKKFLSALIIPDFSNIAEYAKFKKIDFADIKDLVKDRRVHDFIGRRIDEKLKDIPRFARIKKFLIMDKEFSQDRGELTPTLKIRRRTVTEKYKFLLDNLYEEDVE
ncbi:MAG: long-chain fatty acid--CoA ligase [Candidatus Omnitrophica bacterium]|nr:long-chain fatty acid--CoA ligase [Candidatus Omnitrophota bacterium]